MNIDDLYRPQRRQQSWRDFWKDAWKHPIKFGLQMWGAVGLGSCFGWCLSTAATTLWTYIVLIPYFTQYLPLFPLPHF